MIQIVGIVSPVLPLGYEQLRPVCVGRSLRLHEVVEIEGLLRWCAVYSKFTQAHNPKQGDLHLQLE